MMKQIFYSEATSIKFDEASVYINDHLVNEEEREGATFEAYAIEKMRQTYGSIISGQYENIIVLTGAGSSINVGIGEKKGKLTRDLWQILVDEIGFTNLDKFAKSINFAPIDQTYTDLEELLSQAKISEAYQSRTTTKEMIDRIEKIIRASCDLRLTDGAPHIAFLRKLTSRKLKYSRIKIFTLNYDLLFEQAASQGSY
jgi:hypothetical protein